MANRYRRTYLVTGGAGFIGSHLAARLVARGARVVVVDDLSTGRRENVPRGAELVRMDIAEPRHYRRLARLRAVDAVLHLAAQSSGEISFTDPVRDLEVNARGTLLLLEWCRGRGITRFLDASSYTVYGAAPRLPFRVGDPCRPQSFYAVGKLAVEDYLQLYAQQGLRYTVFRMGNVYGPGQNLANMKQGMVSIYLAYLLAGRPIEVRGSLDRYRDFIHVDDVVRYWLAALRTPRSVNRVYNLGTGTRTTVRLLLRLLIAAGGRDPDRYPVAVLPGTPGDLFGMAGDIRPLVRDFGFAPRIDLPTGIGRLLRHYREPRAGAVRR